MTGRSYLSIGDVLTLLREEFPDVTISKIRFLESQGLVNPERSPSGYRKFFEADVERLRWVLRQQREHFLPLKVIRDRLSEGDSEDIGGEDDMMEEVPEPTRRNGKVHQPAHAAHGAHAAGASTAGTRAGAIGDVSSTRTVGRTGKADDDVMARILADASRRTAQLPEAGTATDRAPQREGAEGERASAPTAMASTVTAPAAPTRSPAVVPPPPRTGTAHEEGSRREVSPPVTREASEGRPSEPGRMKAPVPGGRAPAPRAASTSAGAPTTSGMVTGASLTTEELCTACGLSEVELASLQGFGLIESAVVAGIVTFNEDALTIANLAAEFRKFGIEPRHLRLYRNAADRELGLIEQVIIPLLRQRNPESRQRAVEGATELGSLGQSMRAALLRSALRRHLGG
ncbi:MAG TPA: MerR family transcriptional regulator [Acidimicrobiales bacterium]|nr:MerR family transcriptional regulator [Acidimicrobiales bacterium]